MTASMETVCAVLKALSELHDEPVGPGGRRWLPSLRSLKGNKIIFSHSASTLVVPACFAFLFHFSLDKLSSSVVVRVSLGFEVTS